MSFADGFTQGFGLIQDVKQSNDRMALERERLAEDRRQADARLAETRRANDLNYDINLKKADIDNRLTSIEETLAPFKTAQMAASTKGTEANTAAVVQDTAFDAEFVPGERAAGIANTKSNTNLNDSRAEFTDANTEQVQVETGILRETGEDAAKADINETRARTDAITESTRGDEIDNNETLRQNIQVAGANAMQLMIEMSEDVVAGSIPVESFQRAAELNKNTITEAGFIFDPSFDYSVQQLQQDIADGNFDGNSGVAILNALARPTNRYNEGQIVNENFVNAPDAFKDGTYKVVSSQFSTFEPTEDGTGITGEILTVVENANGEQYFYTAPATMGRGTDSRQPLVLPVDELVAGVAGVQQMRQGMLANKNQVNRAAKISKFGQGAEGERQYQDALEAKIDSYLDVSANNPQAPSPVSGMDMKSFVTAKNGELMAQHAENVILHDYDAELYTREMYDQHMAGVRQSKEAKMVQARLGQIQLTNKELEEVQILSGSKGVNEVVQIIKRKREAAGIPTDGGDKTIGATQLDPALAVD